VSHTLKTTACSAATDRTADLEWRPDVGCRSNAGEKNTTAMPNKSKAAIASLMFCVTDLVRLLRPQETDGCLAYCWRHQPSLSIYA
jgi:hypothetical protein